MYICIYISNQCMVFMNRWGKIVYSDDCLPGDGNHHGSLLFGAGKSDRNCDCSWIGPWSHWMAAMSNMVTQDLGWDHIQFNGFVFIAPHGQKDTCQAGATSSILHPTDLQFTMPGKFRAASVGSEMAVVPCQAIDTAAKTVGTPCFPYRFWLVLSNVV